METKWLEDFVSLAETRSFSRSAQLRHVTQPAFSRRIQALEAWAGTDLVDRSSYPTRLTPAGKTRYEQALEILPEFAKYLPQERDGKVIRSMPVIANLVADLMQAGWPKDKAKAQAAAG